MLEPPAHLGYFVVHLKGRAATWEMWYWDGNAWRDSDDGLGFEKPVSRAAGWYGLLSEEAPPGTPAHAHRQISMALEALSNDHVRRDVIDSIRRGELSPRCFALLGARIDEVLRQAQQVNQEGQAAN